MKRATRPQVEETHNTLKFAMRAKMIRVTATRNHIDDERSQIAAYQRQIAELHAQLAHVTQAAAVAAAAAATAVPAAAAAAPADRPQRGAEPPAALRQMQRKVLQLREQLEEERAALLSREAEKAALEARIERLTRIVLNSTRALICSPARDASDAAAAAPAAGSELRASAGGLDSLSDSMISDCALGATPRAERPQRVDSAGQLLAAPAAPSQPGLTRQASASAASPSPRLDLSTMLQRGPAPSAYLSPRPLSSRIAMPLTPVRSCTLATNAPSGCKTTCCCLRCIAVSYLSESRRSATA
jgi:hypothetical protein